MKRSLYIPFVVLIVCFFNLLVLSGCVQNGLVRGCSAGSGCSDQPGGCAAGQPEAQAPPAIQQKAIMPENREVVAQEETPMSNIYFDFDKYNLRDEDKKMLKEHADWLMKNEAYRIRIEGNCDERGSEKYNMALGQRRADAAKNYLVKMGVNKKRISTISYGKDRPVDPGHDEAAWAKNRNDHFVLTVYK